MHCFVACLFLLQDIKLYVDGVIDMFHYNIAMVPICSFYFGSHYSSMGIVLYYLLRLEPFTALHRNLQVLNSAIFFILVVDETQFF